MVVFWISFAILLGTLLFLLGYLISLVFKLKPSAEKALVISEKLTAMRDSLNESIKKLH